MGENFSPEIQSSLTAERIKTLIKNRQTLESVIYALGGNVEGK